MKKGEISAVLPKSLGLSDKLLKLKTESRFIETLIIADSPEFIPQYMTKGAACCDLLANIPNGVVNIAPKTTEGFDCGFAMRLPEGYEAQIRSRSGLASRGVVVTNGIGTIDCDYLGRIRVMLTNIGEQSFKIEHMQRIAQMAIKPVLYFDFIMVDDLGTTERGHGGFGSTDKGNK